MRVPLATYRLQFTPEFAFHDASDVLDYLSGLGMTDIYASPIFKAREGSMHGYDVADPNLINPQLEKKLSFKKLITAVKKKRMGWLQDIVPNHMVYSRENALLMDVLEKGLQSRYAGLFDINWNHPEFQGRVLAPFLGDTIENEVKKGKVRLGYDREGFFISYYGHRYPVFLLSYDMILSGRSETGDEAALSFLKDIYSRLRFLKGQKDQISPVAFSQKADTLKARLWKVYRQNGKARAHINGRVRSLNRQGLRELLNRQVFLLASWKKAGQKINYRRFFSINDLISLNLDNRKAFDETHQLVRRLAASKTFTGLRVDHIDGLSDPGRYLGWLKKECPSTYIIVEKILEHNEKLPSRWPVAGTTGYDFLGTLNTVFYDARADSRLKSFYRKFASVKSSVEGLLYQKKCLLLKKHFSGDFDNLLRLFVRLAGSQSSSKFKKSNLRTALQSYLAFFPVYRTYFRPGQRGSQADRQITEEVCGRVAKRHKACAGEARFLRDLFMTGKKKGRRGDAGLRKTFVARFQQLTGPLMAKAFEDTVFYNYHKLISLNEVGGHPEHIVRSVEDFHGANVSRRRRLAQSLIATSTHDTKRSEDVRARLNVLSEMPDEWFKRVKYWHQCNTKAKTRLSGNQTPDTNEEYLIYQTILGTYPDGERRPSREYKQRIRDYIIKAVREAKNHTSWMDPDERHEQAVVKFLDTVISAHHQPFFRDFLKFQNDVSYYGKWNALSQTLLKMTSVGIPDFYQGTELWDFSLVDPDNRRPVDYGLRKKYLKELRGLRASEVPGKISQMLRQINNGQIKMYLIWKALNLRRDHPGVFQSGEYVPLSVKGQSASHIIAFQRKQKKKTVIVVACRFFTKLFKHYHRSASQVFESTVIRLPQNDKNQAWTNVLDGQSRNYGDEIRLTDCLRHLPFAVLVKK